MKNRVNKYHKIQGRREFFKYSSKTFIGLLLTGIPFNSLAYEKPTQQQIDSFVFKKFENGYFFRNSSRLLSAINKKDTPLDYTFIKEAISADFQYRWDIAYTLSVLSEEQLITILDGEDHDRFNLKDGIFYLKKSDRKNLRINFKEYNILINPELSDIKPIESIEVVIDKETQNRNYCREIIIQIIFESITGLKLAKETIGKLTFDFIETLNCIIESIHRKNWDILEGCLMNLTIQLFSAKYLNQLRKEIGEEAFKRLLKNAATRFVPVVGSVFFIFQLMLAVKGNWENLEKFCLPPKKIGL